MYGLESLMKIDNVFESGTFPAIIFFKQRLDLIVDIFRLHSVVAAYLIGQFLVITDSKP